MKFVRTPDDRFAAASERLPPPHYVDIPAEPERAAPATDTLRMAYLDTGPRDGPLVLMLHGEPTWSFLYRDIIACVAGAGLRAVAPDLIGFGRSDKPLEITDYSYQRHLDWLWAFLGAIGAREIHLVCHDWGGLLGLRLVAEHPALFQSVVAINTALPTGAGQAPAEFIAWQNYALNTPDLPIGELIRRLTHGLRDDAVAAYDAPFPDASYKAGARAFPRLVPTTPDDPAAPANRAAWESLARFDRPFLTLFSHGDGDPMTRGNDRAFHKKIPGCRGQPHATLVGKHFLQEDAGLEIGQRICDFVGSRAR